jgi:hypothetical protein
MITRSSLTDESFALEKIARNSGASLVVVEDTLIILNVKKKIEIY